MQALDWIVLSATLLFIVLYGVWKTDIRLEEILDEEVCQFEVSLEVFQRPFV